MRVLIASADSEFAQAARLALRSESLVLDLALPGARGVDLLKRLRRQRVAAGIIALTADAKPEARIEALRFGADDCLVKPVLLAELAARVHALTRRAGRKAGCVLEVEDLVLHCDKRRAFRAGRALPLTGRKFAALEHIVRAHGKPVSTAELLDVLWHEKDAPKENFVAVLMMRVRRKVDDGHETKLVHTIRGSGYSVTAFDA